MYTEDQTAPQTATKRYNKARPLKLLHSYLENVSYQSKKYATDAAFAEYDATILRCMQSASITTNNLQVT